MRLRVLLLVMSLLISVLPVGLFWLWPYSQALQTELEGVRDRHAVLADKVGVALERYHHDATAIFAMLALNLAQGREPAGASALLASLHFRHLCLVDKETGRIRSLLVSDPAWAPASDAVAPERLATLRALAKPDVPAMSGVMATPDNKPMLAIVQDFGEFLAYAALDTEYLVALARTITFGKLGHAVIVDEAGRVLAHPLASWVHDMHDLSKLPVVQKLRQRERGIAEFYSPAFKEDMIAAYTPVAGTGWGVMVPQPLSELHAQADKVRRSNLIVLVGGLAVALLLAATVSLLVLAPVRAVIAAARRRAAGDTSARADEHVGRLLRDGRELTQAFNLMADRLDSARAQQQAALIRAVEASAGKTRFLANVSHELRTPLNAVIGFSELLLRGDADSIGRAKHAEYLGYIHRSGMHLLSLINDLLDLSKIEAGVKRIDDSEFPMRSLLAEAVALMRTQAESREIRLILVDDNPAVRLRADERALRQVLLNLMVNAVRYTHVGDSVTLRAVVSDTTGVEITVTDNGPGIPAVDIDRVLEPFQRGTHVAVRGAEGTGLGLAISRRLMELHGGTLRLDSEIGRGTIVTITLPATRILPPEASPQTGIVSAA